jgi:ketosteroid isomerase-like protein
VVATTAQLLRRVCDAIEAGDLDRIGRTLASDIVFRGTLGGIDEAVVLHGADAAISYMRDVSDTWDEWRFETEQLLENGDTVVVFWRETSRSRGIEVVTETATVFHVRDGKIVEWRGYLDRAQALAAAGLA